MASLPGWLALTRRHRRGRERPDRVVLDRGVVLAVLAGVRVVRLLRPAVRWGRDRMVLVVRVGPHRDSDGELIDERAVVRLGGRPEMGHRSPH
ncbi:hypothetical protein A5747_06255 [Mycobacterium sp. IS-836]|uniref:hypothetical protein n=1 Tax=Mycobacterium sp. IS-836 TaxID=1834160 RepID=UPI000979D1F8|nr:hypothetical protein [Mycobacterium sp. IS-836]OMC56846.1 hypothetical protein A5747_06255 [Mycobacterium sp. IS-836]